MLKKLGRLYGSAATIDDFETIFFMDIKVMVRYI